MRAFDACTNLAEVASLAALVHCLVEDFSTRLDRGEELPTMPQWFIDENKWRSARYGMDAILILDEHGEEDYVAHTVARMLADLAPVAERLGCSEELAGVGVILDKGAGYQRQTTAAREQGNLEAVVDLMVEEMDAGRPL